MRFRLDEQTYVNDRLLEPGWEVGDGPDSVDPWKYSNSDANKLLRGTFRPPGRYTTPLDDEARKAFEDHFGAGSLENRPDMDPTKAIPVTTVERDAQGNVKKASVPGTGSGSADPPLPPLPPSKPLIHQEKMAK